MKASGWTGGEKLDYEGISTSVAPPAPGLYKARITEAKPQPTKENKPMIKLTVELYEDADGNGVNKFSVTDNLALGQATRFRILILSKALDIEPLSDSSLEPTEEFCREVVKAAKDGVFVRVVNEEWTGQDGSPRTSTRIKRYFTFEEVAETKSSKAPEAASNGASARRPRGSAMASA